MAPRKPGGKPSAAQNESPRSAEHDVGDVVEHEALRLWNVRNSGIDELTGDVALSFLSEDGQEHWIQFPREAAWLVVGAILEALKMPVAKTGGSDPEHSHFRKASLLEGMRPNRLQVEASMEGQCALLTFETVAGLRFEFPVPEQDIPKLRVALRKAEEFLNQAKRRERGHCRSSAF